MFNLRMQAVFVGFFADKVVRAGERLRRVMKGLI